ncbi:leishmanolysin-like peptidase 2 isoform X2 [Alosa sapidissima]|uniref:leishmanolysin-like peptidase 2 isoform X2 n=1 Tax=Alosa sapidissima TaxID=34773 RepID=UPI001C084157|nr:leishmanolysin-like peptidase 2 isoform X2 [Alosa sapidissima]
MLIILPQPSMLLLLLWLQSTQGRCVFDEVQQSVRVVTPITGSTPTKHSELSDSRPVFSASEQIRAIHQHSHWTRGTSLQNLQPQRTIRQGLTAMAPIRIKIWIPQESVPLSEVDRERLDSAINQTVSIVSSLLSVRHIPGPLLLSRDINKYCKFIWRNASAANYNRCGRANGSYRNETCLDVVIPDEHLRGFAVFHHPDSPISTEFRREGAGLDNTDFLLYLHIQNSRRCSTEPSMLAYAAHCQTDPQGRPLAGTVVICRDQLRQERYRHETTVQLLIHELFHVLGFSRTLFSTWRDCFHTRQAGIECIPHGRVTNLDNTGHMRIYTQSVVRALQEHLNSTDPQLGGPLENLDADFSGLSSHWEARVLLGSIMAAALGEPSTVQIDQMTLAALQDTGWYSANSSRAQSLVWGQGEGSHFGTLSMCNASTSSYFCTGSGLGCHYHHLHKGECQTDHYLEGCRIYKPLSECWKEENQPDSMGWSGEIYHSESRCFFSNLSRENTSLRVSVTGHCYRHRCTGMRRYQIKVLDAEWLDCSPGSAIEVPGYVGVVFCPEKILCSQSDHTTPVNNLDHVIFPVPDSSVADLYYSHAHQTADPNLTFDADLLSSVPWESAKVIVPALLALASALSLIIVFGATYKVLSVQVRVHAEAPDVVVELS